MHLVDYKVRVINSRGGHRGRGPRGDREPDEDDVWGTVGVSENVIEASWIALVDSFEYKLYKDEECGRTDDGRMRSCDQAQNLVTGCRSFDATAAMTPPIRRLQQVEEGT